MHLCLNAKTNISLCCMQDVLNEVERNLHDAMGVARNVAMDPRLVPGGGAVEMAVSRALNDKASTVSARIRLHACLSEQLSLAISHMHQSHTRA